MPRNIEFHESIGWLLVACVLGHPAPSAAAVPAASSAPATISSDQLEMMDNGAQTIFKGHVILKQDPYVLRADKMVQTKTTQVVEAYGHINGTWLPPTGEKIVATGDRATYQPDLKLTDLWGHAQVTRWETVKDTNPVVAVADHFTASEMDHTILAKENVFISQGPALWVRSDQARYVQAEKVIYFWGTHRVAVHYEGPKQHADFTSDKAEMTLAPKKARLIELVRGHVIPL